RPSSQPKCFSSCKNTVMRALVSGSSPTEPMMIPSRRIRSPCCARTVSGHTAAEPAMALMKSRRLIAYPEDKQCYRQTLVPWKGSRMSALGQKRTFRYLRPMSALPPKADIAERDWHVRFVPIADIRATPSAPGQGKLRVWLYQEIEAVFFKDRLRCLRAQE